MQTWQVTNLSGDPIVIQGEDLVSAMSRHREALLDLAFPGGVEAIETAWMHWDQDLLDGEGAIEVILTCRQAGTERQGRILIHAVPGEIAPGTGRTVFF